MLLQLFVGPKSKAEAKSSAAEKKAPAVEQNGTTMPPDELRRKNDEATRAIEAQSKAPKLPDRPVTTTEHLGSHPHGEKVSCEATATKVDGKTKKIEESCTDGTKDSWSVAPLGRFGLHKWWNTDIKK